MSEKETLGLLAEASSGTIATILSDRRIPLTGRIGFAKQVLVSSGDNGIIDWASLSLNSEERQAMLYFIIACQKQILKATLASGAGWKSLLKFVAPVERSHPNPSRSIKWWLCLFDVANGLVLNKVQDLLWESYQAYNLHEWLASDEMTQVFSHPYITDNPCVLPSELFGYLKGLKLGLAQTTPEAAAKKLIDCPEIIGHALEAMNQVEVQKEIQHA